MTGQCTTAPYFHLLSHGNLTLPSHSMAEFTCSAFALQDYYDLFIAQQKVVAARCGFVRFAKTLKTLLFCAKHNNIK